MSDPGQPIRAVHLVNQLGRGGTERQLVLLLTHLPPERVQNRVVVFNPSAHAVWDDELRAHHVEVESLSRTSAAGVRRLLALAQRMRAWQTDVVHSWTVHDNPYAGLAGWLAGVPVRWGSLRGSMTLRGFRSLPRWARYLCLSSVQKIVVNAGNLRSELEAAGVAADRIVQLPNCVPPVEPVAPADLTELGIPASAPLVGLIGNLRHVKNPLLFVRAMSRVVHQIPEARGIVVGQAMPAEPEIAEQVTREIRSLQLESRVIVAGFRPDIAAVMKRLQVLVSTSRSEGLPNVLLEALAAGKPVVATRVGGVPELIRHQQNGLLVDPSDADDVAASIVKLLMDPQLGATLGRQGQRWIAAHHSCDLAAKRLEGLYLAALANRDGEAAFPAPSD